VTVFAIFAGGGAAIAGPFIKQTMHIRNPSLKSIVVRIMIRTVVVTGMPNVPIVIGPISGTIHQATVDQSAWTHLSEKINRCRIR
jgi:hypothetical protein